ncbi:hypothetical protein LCGC14_0570630 [marine sediment metagenome]|uniref:MOSC domain-containing protein n=1 Tax=marine sediment metagenome TaxID=412755 RepID=A0A0F9RPE6_9ZZZZ|nr:MOSC domain-containing protein [Methylophaga sp.]
MIKVGTVKEIWRYPVKGMAGEALQQCRINERGLAGDRLWALRDVLRQEIQSCKFRPELLTCIAKFRDEQQSATGDDVDITFSDGKVMGSDDLAIHQLLSELTGHQSTLEVLRGIEEIDFYRRHKKDSHTWLDELKATFERQEGEPLPDLDNLPQSSQDYVSIPGTFFLVAPFHFITTSTLAHMKSLNPNADWAIERFRPNVVIETLPHLTGLIEQEWLGNNLLIGDSMINCNDTTPRCGVVTKRQQHIEKNTDILRTIVKEGEQNLGTYGAILKSGLLTVGDDVFLSHID